MINISDYISDYHRLHLDQLPPWELTSNASALIESLIVNLNSSYIVHNGIAIHTTATVEDGAILKPSAHPTC